MTNKNIAFFITFFFNFYLYKMTSTTLNKNLIEQFAPIVYFHRGDSYLPLAMNIILKNSTLKNFTTGEVIHTPSNREIYDFAKSSNFSDLTDGSIVLSINESLYNHSYPLEEQPVYAIIREKDGKTYITYILVFPYNGDYTILRHGKAGSHPGDLEHYTVELSSDKKLLRVFFGAHGAEDGRWVLKDDLEFEHGKIVVYSSLNGHGLYNKEGTVFRIFGLANDYLERGARWNPNVIEIFGKDNQKFDIDTMGWTVYNGRFGGSLDKPNTEGISGLTSKDWYGPDGNSINNLDEKFYKPPPIISNKIAKPLFFLSHSMTIALIYAFIFLLLVYMEKHITLFNNNPFLKSLIAIMLLKILYQQIPNEDNNIIYKHMLGLTILLSIFYFFGVSERDIREKI
jgi:hypothetical protein